jgi:hypothetical protein
MMAHELLRKAALILADGWCKGGDASDDAGRILPLWSGAVFQRFRTVLACTIMTR